MAKHVITCACNLFIVYVQAVCLISYFNVLPGHKDLVTKWEKYVAEHETYEKCHSEFSHWLTEREQQGAELNQPVPDHNAAISRKQKIQVRVCGSPKEVYSKMRLVTHGYKIQGSISMSLWL